LAKEAKKAESSRLSLALAGETGLLGSGSAGALNQTVCRDDAGVSKSAKKLNGDAGIGWQGNCIFLILSASRMAYLE
jgi:hypothetical protein